MATLVAVLVVVGMTAVGIGLAVYLRKSSRTSPLVGEGSYPSLGEFRVGPFGDCEGEASLTPAHRVHVTYVCHPKAVSLEEASGIVRATLEQVARNEWDYRLKAGRAWVHKFHEQASFGGGWSEQDLARRLVLRGIVLGGDHEGFTLVYGGRGHKDLNTWFNIDGTVSHISGDVCE